MSFADKPLRGAAAPVVGSAPPKSTPSFSGIRSSLIHPISSFNHAGMDYARSASSEGSAAWRGFPTDPAEFANDPRISFSKPDDTYILETEDGEEYLWNGSLKRWVRQVCDYVKSGTLQSANNQMSMCDR
jgi:hypothetical protein